MPRPRRSVGLVVLVALTLTACSGRSGSPTASRLPVAQSWAAVASDVGGLTVTARTAGARFELPTRGGVRTFLPGVDLGATTPGHSPGELSIPASDYRSFFGQMGAAGVRVIRIYTLHRPVFYDELARYDRAHPDAPLLLMQGAYLPDESYVTTGDVFAPGPTRAFVDELHDVVSAVHGDLSRAATPGRASGRWRTDVSSWVVGYVIGIEMDPGAVARSDVRNARQPAYDGAYFSSGHDATPTERWLSRMLDETAAAEARRGRSVPVAFTNWPTTDPLPHPKEPLRDEDLVGLDANHVVVHRERWPAGYFASYHAYPYYPDFQRQEYAAFRYNGRVDPYAGYLSALKAHHAAVGIPVVITELGVPASLGNSHAAPLGRSQGDHSEQEQAALDAELVTMVKALGLSGALLFSWVDEPFKFTWNTIDRDLPADRRAFWRDAQTNEQGFGLVSVDPHLFSKIVLDGRLSSYESTFAGDGVDLAVAHDEEWLYVGLSYDPQRVPAPQIGIDVVPGAAPRMPDGGVGPAAASGADVVVQIPAPAVGPSGAGGAAAPVLVTRRGADYTTTRYAVAEHYLPMPSTNWVPERMLIGRPSTNVHTGQSVPADVFDLSAMRVGTTAPSDPAFDSRTRAAYGHAGTRRVVELRIEWAAVGFGDPSTRTALLMHPDGSVATAVVPDIGLSVSDGETVALQHRYTWPAWDVFDYHYRVKAGFSAVRSALVAAAG